MISNPFRIILFIILETGIFFAILEFWWLIVSGITALRMLLFSRQNSLIFQPGIGSFFISRPFKLISKKRDELTIVVDINPNRRFYPSNLSLFISVNNHKNASLSIRRRNFIEKTDSHSEETWGKNLLIQCTPASLGKTIFQSSELLQDTIWLMGNFFPARRNYIKLLSNGQLEISIQKSGFSSRRVNTAIKLARNISAQIKAL